MNLLLVVDDVESYALPIPQHVTVSIDPDDHNHQKNASNNKPLDGERKLEHSVTFQLEGSLYPLKNPRMAKKKKLKPRVGSQI